MGIREENVYGAIHFLLTRRTTCDLCIGFPEISIESISGQRQIKYNKKHILNDNN